jgi:hypothetical protein
LNQEAALYAANCGFDEIGAHRLEGPGTIDYQVATQRSQVLRFEKMAVQNNSFVLAVRIGFDEFRLQRQYFPKRSSC